MNLNEQSLIREDERLRRTVTCGNGHEFTTATWMMWDGLFCPFADNRGQCLKPLVDDALPFVLDLYALRAELEG